MLSEIVRYLRTLAGLRPTAGLADSSLLERFVRLGDEAAFEALFARHGPMVLGVCRSLLPSVHEAEDAFAATFLIFVRKAESIGRGEMLANWLYGVAHRVAVRARANAARHQARERGSVEMLAANSSDDVATRDRDRVLHEELNRLPAKLRTPLVLFYLQGKSQEAVAQELDCTPGAVRGRLERGRERLRSRLASRGLVLSAAVLTGVLESRTLAATVPNALFTSTLKTVLLMAAGGSAAGTISAPVAALVEGVIHAMFMTKIKMAAAVVLVLGMLGTGVGVMTYQGVRAQAPPAVKKEAAQPDPLKQRADDLIEKLKRGEQVSLQDMPEDQLKSMLANLKDGDKTASLLKEQYHAARTEANVRWLEFIAGRGTLHILLSAYQRLLQAEFDLSSKRLDRTAALEAQWLRTRLVESESKRRYDDGRIPVSDFEQSRFNRVRAGIMLERAKQGRWPTELID